jgi:hypothetical protein
LSNTVSLQAILQFNLSTAVAAQAVFPTTAFPVAGDHFTSSVFTVPTTAGGTAIPLGGVATPGGYLFVKNNDATNYVQLLTAVSGTAFCRLNPGEPAVFRLDAGLTAPAALAHTGACEIQFLLLDA